MESLVSDLRYALRSLAKSPGFCVVAILTLGLGIGANTAIFSLVNTLVLRPLPVEDAGRVVRLDTGLSHTSYPNYEEFRQLEGVFTGLLAHHAVPLNLGQGESIQRVFGDLVTGNYFPLLGVRAQLGRTFATEVDTGAGSPVAVISDGMWRHRFGADPGIVGQTLVLNSQPFTIVGVAPAGFHGTYNFGLAPEVWAPLAMQRTLLPGPDRFGDRSDAWLEVFGRLKPGANLTAANAAASALGQRLAGEYGTQNPGIEYTSVLEATGQNAIQGVGARGSVLVFMGLLLFVALLVLGIACANLIGLQLARALARRHEISVRLALGATRWRLVRQLLTENLLLALVAGGAACLVAVWATDALRAWQPPIPETTEIDLRVDGRVLAYTLGISLLTGLFFGLVPALRASRPNVVPRRNEYDAPAGTKGRRMTLRDGLVAAQVGLCLVLLVCAGLFLRSLGEARRVDPGFDADRVLTMRIDLEASGYDDARGMQFVRELTGRIEELPGVEAASTAVMVPLTASRIDYDIELEGRSGERQHPFSNTVGPRYFEVMGIGLVGGRDFTSRDTVGAPLVAIVNETAARRFWPGAEAIGKRLRPLQLEGEAPWLEIVGVAANSKHYSYGEEPSPVLYLPAEQHFERRTVVHVRTAGTPMAWIGPVRRSVQALDRTMLAEMATLRQQIALGLLPGRVASGLLGCMGLLGLGLALVGVYGVVSYVMRQRTREMGTRLALGAQPRDLFALVLGRGLRLAAWGVLGGTVLALGVTRVLRSMLVGTSPSDPLTYGAVALLLLGAVALACFVPARRAARVDPIVALRYE